MLLLFTVLGFASPADAEPVSIRCEGKYNQQQQPYFVTYDLQTNRFVFESPVGNLLPGEIVTANDGRLDLSLSASGGRILLSFDRKRGVMRWPGMPAGELGRPLLDHACTAVTDRTMLSSFFDVSGRQTDLNRRNPVDAFSISCPGNTVKYLSLSGTQSCWQPISNRAMLLPYAGDF